MTALSAITQAAPTRTAAEPRLIKAAHEFEAQLMKELLKPMTHSGGMEDDSESGSGGALADFATEALGQALSWRGGLGISESIVHNLSRNETGLLSPSDSGKAAPDISPSFRDRLK